MQQTVQARGWVVCLVVQTLCKHVFIHNHTYTGDGVFPNAPLEEQLNAEAAHAAEQLQLAAERHRTEYFAVKRAARLHVAEQQATQQRMDVREPGS